MTDAEFLEYVENLAAIHRRVFLNKSETLRLYSLAAPSREHRRMSKAVEFTPKGVEAAVKMARDRIAKQVADKLTDDPLQQLWNNPKTPLDTYIASFYSHRNAARISTRRTRSKN